MLLVDSVFLEVQQVAPHQTSTAGTLESSALCLRVQSALLFLHAQVLTRLPWLRGLALSAAVHFTSILLYRALAHLTDLTSLSLVFSQLSKEDMLRLLPSCAACKRMLGCVGSGLLGNYQRRRQTSRRQ